MGYKNNFLNKKRYGSLRIKFNFFTLILQTKGGTFFGVVETVIGGENLQISTNGHNGQIELIPLNNSPLDIQLLSNNTHSKILKNESPANDFGNTVTRYKGFLLSRMYGIKSHLYANFYAKLYKSSLLIHTKGTNFAEELLDLENYFSINTDRDIQLLLYTTWSNALNTYKRSPKEGEKTNDYKYLFTTLSEMVRINKEHLQKNDFNKTILDISSYLDYSISNSKLLKDAEGVSRYHRIRDDFKNDIENEIVEIGKLIKDELQVYLDKRVDDIDVEIKKLSKEVDEMIDKKETSVENLRKKKNEIDRNLKIRICLTFAQIAFLAMTFINPVVGLVGLVLSTGASIGESFLPVADDKTYGDFQIPPIVSASLERTFKYQDDKIKEEIALVDEKLRKIKAEKDKLVLEGENVEPLIDLENKVQEVCVSNQSPRNCMLDVLEKEENKWTLDNEANKKKQKKAVKYLRRVSLSLDIAKLGLEATNKIVKEVSSRNKIDIDINKNLEDINNLQQFNKKIQKELEPKIIEIRKNIRRVTNTFVVSKTAVVKFQKWQMDKYIRGISLELKTWTDKFKVGDEIKEILSKIHNAINFVGELHNIIDNFRLKIKEADYLGELLLNDRDSTNIYDPILRKYLSNIRLIHYANKVIYEYRKFVTGIKQYTYPFIDDYSGFTSDVSSDFNDIVLKAVVITNRLRDLKLHFQKEKGHGRLFTDIDEENFGDGFLKSFYTWYGNEYTDEIQDILEGNKVNLFANISKNVKLSAVKFNRINVMLTSNNPVITRMLEKNLGGVGFELVHNGDSYYRCNDKVHVIESGPVDFSARANNSESFVLSPFATWTIELSSLSKERDLSPLIDYVFEINLELFGRGQFMSLLDDTKYCEKDFGEYEKEIEF